MLVPGFFSDLIAFRGDDSFWSVLNAGLSIVSCGAWRVGGHWIFSNVILIESYHLVVVVFAQSAAP